MTDNKFAKQLHLTSLALVSGQIVLLLTLWKLLPPTLPWLYSLPMGDQQLVSKTLMLTILTGVLGGIWLTRVVSKWVAKSDESVENTVVVGGLIVAVLVTASFLRIVQIFIL